MTYSKLGATCRSLASKNPRYHWSQTTGMLTVDKDWGVSFNLLDVMGLQRIVRTFGKSYHIYIEPVYSWGGHPLPEVRYTPVFTYGPRIKQMLAGEELHTDLEAAWREAFELAANYYLTRGEK